MFDVILEVWGNEQWRIATHDSEDEAIKAIDNYLENVDGYGEKYNIYIEAN